MTDGATTTSTRAPLRARRFLACVLATVVASLAINGVLALLDDGRSWWGALAVGLGIGVAIALARIVIDAAPPHRHWT